MTEGRDNNQPGSLKRVMGGKGMGGIRSYSQKFRHSVNQAYKEVDRREAYQLRLDKLRE